MPQTHIIDAGGARRRWPLAYPPLPAGADGIYAPPDASDLLTNPDPDMLARQVAKLAPRGRAWNTDEAAAPWGSRVQHGVWRLIASGLVAVYLLLARVKNSAFPGLSDDGALAEWEAQHGLPDPCGDLSDHPALRRRAVQAARILAEGASRHDMLRVLIRAGAPATVSVTERRGFECGWSECGAVGLEGGSSNHKFYVSGAAVVTWLQAGGNSLATPLGEISNGNIPCVLARTRHAHTISVLETAGGL